MDIVTHFFHSDLCDIHLNHGDLLDAIWSWTGIKAEHRQKVAEVRLPNFLLNRALLSLQSIACWMIPFSNEASLHDGFFASTIFRKEIKMGTYKAPASAGVWKFSELSKTLNCTCYNYYCANVIMSVVQILISHLHIGVSKMYSIWIDQFCVGFL